jgi:hypothetical protein
MFKVAAEPRFTHEVKVKVPVDGGFQEETFKATFRVLGPAKLEAVDLTSATGSMDFLREVIVSLDDLADAEGKPVDYSDEMLGHVLKLPYARRAMAQTYFDAVSGARQGN